MPRKYPEDIEDIRAKGNQRTTPKEGRTTSGFLERVTASLAGTRNSRMPGTYKSCWYDLEWKRTKDQLCGHAQYAVETPTTHPYSA